MAGLAKKLYCIERSFTDEKESLDAFEFTLMVSGLIKTPKTFEVMLNVILAASGQLKQFIEPMTQVLKASSFAASVYLRLC